MMASPGTHWHRYQLASQEVCEAAAAAVTALPIEQAAAVPELRRLVLAVEDWQTRERELLSHPQHSAPNEEINR